MLKKFLLFILQWSEITPQSRYILYEDSQMYKISMYVACLF